MLQIEHHLNSYQKSLKYFSSNYWNQRERSVQSILQKWNSWQRESCLKVQHWRQHDSVRSKNTKTNLESASFMRKTTVLKSSWENNSLGIDGDERIIYNWVQTSFKNLPIEIEYVNCPHLRFTNIIIYTYLGWLVCIVCDEAISNILKITPAHL